MQRLANDLLLERFLLLVESNARGQQTTLRGIKSVWGIEKTAAYYSIERIVALGWLVKREGGSVFVPSLIDLLSHIAKLKNETFSIKITLYATGSCSIKDTTEQNYNSSREYDDIVSPSFIDAAMIYIKQNAWLLESFKVDNE